MKARVIEIKNLNFSYPDSPKVLIDIDMDILEGESVGIIGPNGAGKSTLLLHMNGLINGKIGIKIFGLEPNKDNMVEIRKRVGFVFQNSEDQLFMPTVFEDVSFGPLNLNLPKEEIVRNTEEALEEVEMFEKKDHLSHHLSIGEQKRVAIATVLSMKPEVLILDEPSSNLDPHSRRHLIELIKSFKATKIIATHDLEMILQLCDRVFIMDKGKIISEGIPEDLLSNEGLMENHGLEVPASLRK